MALKVDEATALYESVGRQTDGFTRDRDGGDADALAVDRVFALVVLAGGSKLALHREVDTLLPAGDVAASDERSGLLLGARHMVLCGSCYERASFEECRRHAMLARTHFGDETRYGNIVFDVYQGMAAMAEGRVQEAAECYARARRSTKMNFPTEPCLAVCVDAVAIELDLERNRGQAIEQRVLNGLAELRAIWTDIDALAISVTAELTFEQHDRDAVIRLLQKTLDDLRAMRSETLSNCIAGLLVFYLVEVGRTDQAARAWRDHALPDDVSELLDLDGQPWRTMESIACARIWLLLAQSEFAAAAELASRLCATAFEHGLFRTMLRGLALSMVVAERAGQPDRALERLAEFLAPGPQGGLHTAFGALSPSQSRRAATPSRHRPRRRPARCRPVDAGSPGRKAAGSGLLAAGAAGTGRSPSGPAEQGDGRPPGHLAAGCPLPFEEHLPQDGRQPQTGSRAHRAVDGRSGLTDLHRDSRRSWRRLLAAGSAYLVT